jgi:hypothetical protein
VRALGVRAYARHRGCAPSSVVTAIADGRITVSRGARGRPQIDPATADRQWAANTDPAKQRARQNGRGPSHPDGGVLVDYGELLRLLVRIETALGRCLKQATRGPAGLLPAAPWKALYAEWGQIPDVLERLQQQIRVAIEPAHERTA